MRNLGILAEIMAISSLANAHDYNNQHYEPRHDTSNIGGGYHHEGIYSQPKKLRKGAGHKKLTRAQRKRYSYAK